MAHDPGERLEAAVGGSFHKQRAVLVLIMLVETVSQLFGFVACALAVGWWAFLGIPLMFVVSRILSSRSHNIASFAVPGGLLVGGIVGGVFLWSLGPWYSLLAAFTPMPSFLRTVATAYASATISPLLVSNTDVLTMFLEKEVVWLVDMSDEDDEE